MNYALTHITAKPTTPLRHRSEDSSPPPLASLHSGSGPYRGHLTPEPDTLPVFRGTSWCLVQPFLDECQFLAEYLALMLIPASGYPLGVFLSLFLWGVVPPALFAEHTVLVFAAALSAFAGCDQGAASMSAFVVIAPSFGYYHTPGESLHLHSLLRFGMIATASGEAGFVVVRHCVFLLSPLAKWLFSSPRFRRLLVDGDGPGDSCTTIHSPVGGEHLIFWKFRTSPCVSPRPVCVFRSLAMSAGVVVVGPLGTPLPFCGGSTRRDRQRGVCCRLERVAGAGRFPAVTYRNRLAHRAPSPHSGGSWRHHSFFPEPENPGGGRRFTWHRAPRWGRLDGHGGCASTSEWTGECGPVVGGVGSVPGEGGGCVC